MSFRVNIKISVQERAGAGIKPDGVEATFDAVMEQLVEHGAIDPSIGAVGTGTAEIEVEIDQDEPERAVSEALGIVRTALHAAGIGTPGWEIEGLAARRSELVDA